MPQTHTDRFLIAGGSIPGSDHTKPGEPFWRNNNDAYAFFQDETVAIAIVADGCGSQLSVHTEIGAHVVSRLVMESIRKRALEINELVPGCHENEPAVFSEIRNEVLETLKTLAIAMGTKPREIIHTYFMTTIVGCIATTDTLTTFSIGDGFIIINDDAKSLGPFTNNEPPYLVYGLLGTKTADKQSDQFAFKCETYDLSIIDQVLLSTDGFEDIINHEESMIPGLDSAVGSSMQFFQDRFLSNPDNIRRRLSQINRELATVDETSRHARIQKGLLHDDTTIIVMKRNNFS
jgi:hypothetical protein